MTSRVTQADAILAILRLRPQGLTARDAMLELECYRLAARIAELRAQGHNIVTHNETRYGRTYARYKLAPDPMPPKPESFRLTAAGWRRVRELLAGA